MDRQKKGETQTQKLEQRGSLPYSFTVQGSSQTSHWARRRSILSLGKTTAATGHPALSCTVWLHLESYLKLLGFSNSWTNATHIQYTCIVYHAHIYIYIYVYIYVPGSGTPPIPPMVMVPPPPCGCGSWVDEYMYICKYMYICIYVYRIYIYYVYSIYI